MHEGSATDTKSGQPSRIRGSSTPILELRGELTGLGRQGFRAVLIVGESGVGKELVAHELHAQSSRAKLPFEAFNCPAIPQDHLEAELFGTRRGAFPGSVDRPGAAERTDGGVLFLDEIASLDLSHQAKILRLLETGESRRLGGIRATATDVSIVAATNEDLGTFVDQGSFREDLYYRLIQDGILHVPPLRERREDISELAQLFLDEVRVAARLTSESIERLEGENWPGNVRQLRAAVRVAARLTITDRVERTHVEKALQRVGRPEKARSEAETDFQSFHGTTLHVRRRLLVEALEEAEGNQTLAGVLLGLHQRRGEQGGGPASLRARKLAHRKFSYWWHRLVESNLDPALASSGAAQSLPERQPGESPRRNPRQVEQAVLAGGLKSGPPG